MIEIKTLFKQSSHYFIGQIIAVAGSLVSFPILTRIFSVSEYGVLGLITTTIFIANAITKLGIQDSIVRFYAEYKSKGSLNKFYSTIILGSTFISAVAATLFFSMSQVMKYIILDKTIADLLSLVSILIFTGVTTDTLTSFLRAEQRTKYYSLIAIIRRYGALAFGIFFILIVFKDLFGFFLGQVVSGIIIFLFLFYRRVKTEKIKTEYFSFPILKDSIKYGFPLIWAELAHLVLYYLDRYLIQIYLGSQKLGLYTAGFNLATYMTEVIMYPINYAMTPIYMEIITNKGIKEAKLFFRRLFRYFLLILLPVVFGFIATGENLIMVLASKKYLESYSIIPYIIIGQSIYACTIILNSGLFINRKTYILTNIMIIICVIKTGLNMFLIPRYGILGAAQATLLSYIFYASLIIYYSFREFSIPIDYKNGFLYLGASSIMFIIIKSITIGNNIITLFAQIGLGIIIYSSIVLFFDKETRSNFAKILLKAKNKGDGL